MSPLPFPRDMAGGDAAVPRGEQSFGVLGLLPGGCCSLRNPFCRTGSWCVLRCPKSWFLGVLLMGDSSPSVPSVIWQHLLKQDLSLSLGLCLEKGCLTPWGAVTSVLGTPMRVQVFLGCSRAGTGLESHAGSPSAGQRRSVNAPRRCPIRSMPFARSSAAGRGWRWPVKLICLHRVWTALRALGWALGSQRGQLWIFAPTKGREKRCRETWVRGTRLCCGF